VSVLAFRPGVEPRELMATHPPTDEDILATLRGGRGTYGLLASFSLVWRHPRLELARLVEARDGAPLRQVAGWEFGGDNHDLVAGAVALLTEVGRQLGVVPAIRSWTDAFGTTDTGAINNYLGALGYHSACDHGVRLDAPETCLHALHTAIVAKMRLALDLLPALVGSMRESGSADRTILAGAVRAAVDAVGDPPPTWEAMMRALGIWRPRLVN